MDRTAFQIPVRPVREEFLPSDSTIPPPESKKSAHNDRATTLPTSRCMMLGRFATHRVTVIIMTAEAIRKQDSEVMESAVKRSQIAAATTFPCATTCRIRWGILRFSYASMSDQTDERPKTRQIIPSSFLNSVTPPYIGTQVHRS